MSVLPSNAYPARIARAAESLRDAGIDVLLLTPGADLFYLTGFAHGHAGERLLALVLRADGSASWIVPRMNVEQVRAHAPQGQAIRAWADAEGYVPSLREALQGARAVAFDDEARAGFLLDVLAAAPDATPHRASSVMRRLRMRKDATELAALRAAGRTVDETIADAMSFCRPGRTEADVDRDLRAALLARRRTARRVHDRRIGAERRFAAPRDRVARDRAGRRRRGRLRHARADGIPQRHHRHVLRRRAARPRGARGVPRRARRPAGCDRGGPSGRSVRGDRPRGASPSRTGGLRRILPPPHRPRARAAGARAAVPRRGQSRGAGGGDGLQHRARHLPARPVRRAAGGDRGRHVGRREPHQPAERPDLPVVGA